MGAEFFTQAGSGDTAVQAFKQAREAAEHEYGHGGYTGTLAEKGDFVEIDLPEGYSASEYAEKLMHDEDERIDDKWGPAGCLKLGEDKYLFFGWASS
jgi:hypothetical protein